MSNNIETQIKKLFAGYEQNSFFQDSSLIIITHEGQVIVQLGKKLDPSEIHQAGALMAGAWQASTTINSDTTDSKEQVLSLSNSNSGFFIMPFNGNHNLSLGVLYRDFLNPGKLKMKAKLIRDFFSQNLSVKKAQDSASSDEYLFKDITDEELDELFSFAGI